MAVEAMTGQAQAGVAANEVPDNYDDTAAGRGGLLLQMVSRS